MVDRALTFSDPAIVAMLREDFVPVAIDQWYERRQQDAEGEFYRKVAAQGPRDDFQATTQGRYVFTPDGKLLGYNNNRGPERIRRVMQEALQGFEPSWQEAVAPIEFGDPDAQYDVRAPEGALTLRVHSRVLAGYEPTQDWTSVLHEAVGRDNVWITAEEQKELVECLSRGGDVPVAIARRLARFHLVDNTRGEPPRWSVAEIRHLEFAASQDGALRGVAHLETDDGERGFKADLLGQAEVKDGTLIRLDLVAKGEFWGRGPYTGHAPVGRFPLAIAFRIADGTDPSDAVPPHGTKGWVQGYYE